MENRVSEEKNKYSVLMTVYEKSNADQFDTALDSIVNQTVMPDQIVVSADGKLTDELEKVIEKYADEYKNIFTVIHNPKMGNYYAANAGIKKCRNEFIARMDSDDIAYRDRCEKELAEFEKSYADIVGSYADEFIGDRKNIVSVRKVPINNEEIKKYAKKRNPFNHPSIMFRKSAAVKCGGYSRMKRCEDYDFVVKMIMNGAVCRNIPESLLYYRITEDNYSRRKNFDNTKGFIYVRYRNWRRGFCGFFDFFALSVIQIVLFVLPVGITKVFYQKILRK